MGASEAIGSGPTTVETGAAEPSLGEQVHAQVFAGGVYHFHEDGIPNHKPLEEKPGDTEVMLQGMIVRTPEDPIFINGEPYVFEVDETWLVHAVTAARASVMTLGRWEPRMLDISLEDSLPPELEAEDKQRLYPFERKTSSLKVVMPAEVSQSSAPVSELASTVEEAANRELALGLEQIEQMKFRQSFEKLVSAGWASLYTAAGEAVSFAGPDVMHGGTTGRIMAGGIAAYVIGLVGMVGKQFYKEHKFGDRQSVDKIVRKSFAAALKRKPTLEEPVISLTPAPEASISS